MMVVNITGSLILLPILGVYSIPTAYSLAGLIGGLSGIYILRKKVGPFGLSTLYKFTVKTVICTAAMAAVVIPVANMLENLLGRAIMPGTMGLALTNAIKLAVPVGAGIIIFFVLAIILKITEATEMLAKIKVKFRLKRA